MDVRDVTNNPIDQEERVARALGAMETGGAAGVRFCLQQAAQAADAAQAARLKKLAKVIAFNTATNCWPGWGDEGIHIRADHVQAGGRLASICRDLVRELRLDSKEAGNAD